MVSIITLSELRKLGKSKICPDELKPLVLRYLNEKYDTIKKLNALGRDTSDSELQLVEAVKITRRLNISWAVG